MAHIDPQMVFSIILGLEFDLSMSHSTYCIIMSYDAWLYEIWCLVVWDMMLGCMRYDAWLYEIWCLVVWDMMLGCMRYDAWLYEIWCLVVWDMMLGCMRYDAWISKIPAIKRSHKTAITSTLWLQSLHNLFLWPLWYPMNHCTKFGVN